MAKAERKRLMPPHYFFASLLASVGLHFFLPIVQWFESPLRLLGALPVIGGVWIATQSSRLFSEYGTAIRPFERSTALVTDGWFRYSRNPMYLSMILILLGASVLLGSAGSFAPIPVLVVLLHCRFIRVEEVSMNDTFGDAYRQYCERVRRWL